MEVRAERADTGELANRALDFWWHGESDLPAESLLGWLASQRLLPLLEWRAASQGWELPQPLQREARRYRYARLAKHRLVREQLEELAALARSEQIAIALIKGPVLATFYPEPWMRPYNDLDLLVSEDQLSALIAALAPIGYQATTRFAGTRAWHYPPLEREPAGLALEVHTVLAMDKGRPRFTYAQWQTSLQPSRAFEGLWQPDEVEHALYVLYHAVVQHNLGVALQATADLKFWTQSWQVATWSRLAQRAREEGLYNAVATLVYLTAWFWNDSWPSEVEALFPRPQADVFQVAQEIALGRHKVLLPQTWRDLPDRRLSSLWKYGKHILLGEPEIMQEMSRRERWRFYLSRPAYLVKQYAPILWRLLMRDHATRAAWRADQDLQIWLSEE